LQLPVTLDENIRSLLGNQILRIVFEELSPDRVFIVPFGNGKSNALLFEIVHTELNGATILYPTCNRHRIFAQNRHNGSLLSVLISGTWPPRPNFRQLRHSF